MPVKFTLNWWNFELTVFKLILHFKHEMIGIWQRFHRNLELSGTSNCGVRINRSRPVMCRSTFTIPTLRLIQISLGSIHILSVSVLVSPFTEETGIF